MTHNRYLNLATKLWIHDQKTGSADDLRQLHAVRTGRRDGNVDISHVNGVAFATERLILRRNDFQFVVSGAVVGMGDICWL